MNNYSLRILSMAFFTILFVGIIIYIRPEPISSVYEKEAFWVNKVHQKSGYNIVLCGDSRLYRGISTEILQENIDIKGLNILNFGFSSGGLNPEIFKAAEQRLTKTEGIKAIGLVISPYSLTPKAKANKHFIQERDRTFDDIFVRRFIKSNTTFLEPFSPKDILTWTSKKDTIEGYYEQFRPNGWVKSYKIPETQWLGIHSYKNAFDNNQVSDTLINAMINQIKIWKNANIQVFAFRIPSSQAMETLENEKSGFDEKELKNKIQNAGGLWIETPNRFSYPSYDNSHLRQDGAITFSTNLGVEINKVIKKKTLND